MNEEQFVEEILSSDNHTTAIEENKVKIDQIDISNLTKSNSSPTSEELTERLEEELLHSLDDLNEEEEENKISSNEEDTIELKFINNSEQDQIKELITTSTVITNEERKLPPLPKVIDQKRSSPNLPPLPIKNEFEKIDLNNNNKLTLPKFNKSVSPTMNQPPQIPLRCIKLIYSFLDDHSILYVKLQNKNQKICIPQFSYNTTIITRTSTLNCNIVTALDEKTQVKVFQNISNIGTDEIYLSSVNGNARITSIQLKNNEICLKSLENLICFTTALEMSHFQVEEIQKQLKQSTINEDNTLLDNSQTFHFYKFRVADNSEDTEVLLFLTEAHLEIELKNEMDEFIIEQIDRLTAFEEHLNIRPFGDHSTCFLIKGPGKFWLRVHQE
ncbi:hypothetical protein ABK040_001748 [Willaertia magna]